MPAGQGPCIPETEDSPAGQGRVVGRTGDTGHQGPPGPGGGPPESPPGWSKGKKALVAVIVVLIGVVAFIALPSLMGGERQPGSGPLFPSPTQTPVSSPEPSIYSTPRSTLQTVKTGTIVVQTRQPGTETYVAGGEVLITPSNPVAPGFSATPERGPMPLTVTFTDLSAGSPDAWSWDFGDGTTSTVRNPVHTYTSPGSYSVILKVMYSDSSRSTRKAGLIHVSATGGLPEAAFRAEPRNGTPPLTVRFTDESTGAPDSWSWDFGDGTSSTVQDPQHTYVSTGSYIVILTVANRFGQDSVTETGYVRVKAVIGSPQTIVLQRTPTYQRTAVTLPTSDDISGPIATARQNPSARFSYDPASGPLPLTVRFADESTGSPDSWSWDFGDGSSSDLKNPTHTYNDPAENPYIVTLTVSNSQGTSTTKSGTGIEVFYRM